MDKICIHQRQLLMKSLIPSRRDYHRRIMVTQLAFLMASSRVFLDKTCIHQTVAESKVFLNKVCIHQTGFLLTRDGCLRHCRILGAQHDWSGTIIDWHTFPSETGVHIA